MSYGVTFLSPSWCYGGLPSNHDFPNTTQTSPSGYASNNTTVSVRLYSREACENLAEKDNVWSANGECTNVLAEDGEGGFGRFNASLLCSGLNNSSPTPISATLDDLSYDCPKQEDSKIGPLILAGLGGLLVGYLFQKK
jgi:hypothetical protein